MFEKDKLKNILLALVKGLIELFFAIVCLGIGWNWCLVRVFGNLPVIDVKQLFLLALGLPLIANPVVLGIRNSINYLLKDRRGNQYIEVAKILFNHHTCKTCRNPYCSRTLEERQEREVQVHTQYGWECVDKEKWLPHNGGLSFVEKVEE